MDLADDGGSGRSGRWTKQEHELFLQGLNEYGKDWKRIGALIATRTVVQVRTHAQKYFLATKKQEVDPNSSSTKTMSGSSKKRSNSSKKAKKVKKEDDAAHTHDLQLFDVLDAWSSGSDEGSPVSLDDVDLLKAPLPLHEAGSVMEEEVEHQRSESAASNPILHDDLLMDPVTHEDSQRKLPSAISPASVRSPIHGAGIPVPQNAEDGLHDSELQELANGFDPLPPALESIFLGKWMDSMNE